MSWPQLEEYLMLPWIHSICLCAPPFAALYIGPEGNQDRAFQGVVYGQPDQETPGAPCCGVERILEKFSERDAATSEP